MGIVEPHEGPEAQIELWRGYVARRRAISTADLDELEDHLREQIDERRASGLDDDEAFLVAIKRMGNLDAVSREFAREHSERLWKQLVLMPGAPGVSGPGHGVELAVVLSLAIGAGLALKAGISWLGDDMSLLKNASLLVIPFVAAYFAWKRKVSWNLVAALGVAFAAVAVVLNLYPFARGGSTGPLAALHAPVIIWVLVGIVNAGGRWRSHGRRMDFVRFTGELAIYFTLLALGGGVLVGLIFAVLQSAGVDLEPVLEAWILPFAVPGALVVAGWLVEAKQDVIENIAPVLTRVFTPLTIVMLVAMLAVLSTSGGLAGIDRGLLIIINGVLVLVLCLVLYSLSAREPLAPAGLFDTLQLVLLAAALAVDALMLAAILVRIAEFGTSPNKIAALGLNLVLLIHLIGAAWLALGFVRGRLQVAAAERWQMRYLPVYGLWAAVVVFAFPPLFAFS